MASQSKGEKAALDAVWKAHPQVVAFEAAVREHARANRAGSDLDRLNATMRFARAWTVEHGDLPDSGILCD